MRRNAVHLSLTADHRMKILFFLVACLVHETVCALGQADYINNVYNEHPQEGELVEDDGHNIWCIDRGMKRLVPSWRIVLDVFPDKSKNRNILRARNSVLERFQNGTIFALESSSVSVDVLMSEIVPFNSKFSMDVQSPFNFGVPATLSFFVWFWDDLQPSLGHRSIFQTTPMQVESLSLLLYALPGTATANSPKLSLFIGVCTGGRERGKGGSFNLDVKGSHAPNALSIRRWHFVSIVHNLDTISLFVDGIAMTSVNVRELGLNGTGGGAGAISPSRRLLTFGNVESTLGMTGLVSNVTAYDGKSLKKHELLQLGRGHLPRPVPQWLVEVVDASIALDDQDGPLAKETGIVAARNLHAMDEKSFSLFDFGRALVSSPVYDKEKRDWRTSVLQKGILVVAKKRERAAHAWAAWSELSEETLVSRAFESNPCITKNEGWWVYNFCFKDSITQTHSEQGQTKPSESILMGRFVHSSEPIFLVDPSQLFLNCKVEKAQYCPSLSFENAKDMVKCLHKHQKEARMGNKCRSVVSRFMSQSSQVEHTFEHGDQCKPKAIFRKADVKFKCCERHQNAPEIFEITERVPCNYKIAICVQTLCAPNYLHDGKDDSESTELALGSSDAPSSFFTETPSLKADDNVNIFIDAVAEESSIWNHLHRGKKAIDMLPSTSWKSAPKDLKPTLMLTLKKPCKNGIARLKLQWDLAPAAYTVYVSPLGGHNFLEITSIASTPREGRVDELDGWNSRERSDIQMVRVSVDSIGPWSATSLIELSGACASIPAVSGVDKVGKASIGTILPSYWSTRNGTKALLSLQNGVRDSELAHMIWLFHFMHHPRANSNGRDSKRLAHEKTRHALAYNFLRGNQWPTIAPLRGRFGEYQKNDAAKHLFHSDEEVSTAMYFEAALAVIGPDNDAKPVKPAERIFLQKASNELLKQHDGDESDVAVFQKDRAEQGDINAKMWIAGRYYHGLNGFPQDRPRAAAAFREAADAGNAEGAYNYAVMRHSGQDGQPANPAEAEQYFQLATDANFSPALNGLGVQHMRKQEYQTAAGYFKRAAEKLSGDGHYNLGTLYRDGRGVARDRSLALLHFVVAATLGHPRAQFVLGEAYFKRRSWLTADAPSAIEGSENELLHEKVWSQTEGSKIKMTGKVFRRQVELIVEQNEPSRTSTSVYGFNRSCAIALKFLKPLAELGVPSTLTGAALKSWLSEDYVSAELLFEEAAALGLVDAISNLAWIQRGKTKALGDISGLLKNNSTASAKWGKKKFAYFRTAQAAMEGHVDDILIVGAAYESAKQEDGTAMAHYEYAAAHGSQEACFRLGIFNMFVGEPNRRERNDTKALEYFEKGIEGGGVGFIPSQFGVLLVHSRATVEKLFGIDLSDPTLFERSNSLRHVKIYVLPCLVFLCGAALVRLCYLM